MAEIGLLRHLLFLLLCIRTTLCGSINMKGSGEYSVLGSEFRFTCVVVNANVTGLFIFRRRANLSFRPVCGVAVDIGRQIMGIVTYRCSDEDGQRHTYTLTIRDVSRDDSTDWLCQGGGMNSNTVTLDVRSAPSIEYFGVTSGDRTVSVTEHDNVILQCNISSNPASTIEIRNKTSSIGRRKISNYNPVRSYKQTLKAMLLDVSCQEGGEYTCSAGNLIGKAAPQTVLLQVTCAPRRYSSSSDNLVFASNLHENATLSLTVIAFPPPTFKWRKRPDSRPINTTRVNTEGVLVTGSVTILDVKEDDFLNYTVNVENTEGQFEVKIALVSKSKPNIPSSLKATSTCPRSVTLQWEKAFNGGATQSFNIQYREPGGQWITHPTRPSEDDALQLEIDDLEPGTLYQIRMNALNDYGSSSYTSITVTTDTATTSCVPVYVVVIACVASVLLTTAVHIVVLCTKAKCQSQTLTSAEAEGDNETTREDENKGKDLYTSLIPVKDAYENINIDNQPRPSTSTPAASTESPSSDPYYSVIKDTTL